MRMSKLVQVMAILLHHEPQAECSAECDKVWLGGPRPSDLTDYEATSLAALGVRWSELHESWEVST